MKCLCVLLLTVGIASGCNDTNRVAVTSSADPNFDRALGAIEAASDWGAAHSEAARHSVGVLPAIDTLRGYLADDRVISREYSTHSVLGTMGDQAFGAIRDAIETRLPNRYRAYSAFLRSDVEDWLDRHQGKTLVELQIEAASTSLERAQREYELDGNTDAHVAIAVYTELLQARLMTQAIHDILDSDIAYSGLAIMLTRTKNVNLKIYGTIPSRPDLDRLKRRLNKECDIHRSLHWDVRLHDTGETIVGLDRDVYSKQKEMTRAIELTPTPIDDPKFVELVSAFVSHYAVLYTCETVRVIHVGNWFGDRWLGFAGKILGAAGVRNRTVNGPRLPSPPFRPSRIKTVLKFDLQIDGQYTQFKMPIGHIHAEKRGEDFWHLFRPGLFVWYSGNTQSNTTGSLMIYDVTGDGSTGWYVLFENKKGWSVTRSTNVSREECARILDHCRADCSTEPSAARESSS